MTQPHADPFIGRTVAHYHIQSRLGGGGMGVVYKALDGKLGRAVALKFLPQQWSHDEGAKQRFLREAQAASATHHPNICTIHDVAHADDGQLFIVMGYYEGPTLKQRLESGALPVDEALEIAMQVADGLAKAHAQGIVHRDIKPGNLILTEDGVRIVDFGLATFADALQLTAAGATVGTAAYMAPEQVRGEATDARTDVWALGIVLYEMLAGHVPFRGTHAEAIAYAIRHDTPAPLRRLRGDVPEAVEQLVFRALHKDPAIRFQSGRELARAIRQVRGLTLPQDLRTTVIDAGTAQPPERVHARRPRRWIAGAAAVVALLLGMPWLLAPVPRLPVAIAPVGNQTGSQELDAYRMALTSELVSQLADEDGIRVLPYEQLLEIVQRFRASGADVSSREALQAIAAHSGARLLIVPTLVRERDAWTARVALRDPATAMTLAAIETEPVRSALARDTAHALSLAMAARIRGHLLEMAPVRVRVAARLNARLWAGAAPERRRLRTLDAAAAFERGQHSYEQGEYAAAFDAFGHAAERDPADPLSPAWRSRLALLMRQDTAAVENAVRAERLLTDVVPPQDRVLVQAIVAEARRDGASAEARYRELASRRPDEPLWLIELAAFLDRQGRATEAVAAYHEAIRAGSPPVRARLELCRLNSPSRLNEPAAARQEGEQALAAYRALGHEAGEAQALWCLADVLRAGAEVDREQAAAHARAALEIMERLEYPFGRARAANYIAQVALSQRNAALAAEYFERTLEEARAVGNVLLASRTLMNLGVAYELGGRRAAALGKYREAFDMFEASGSQQDAAWTQINAAAIRIQYGQDPDAGLREAEHALAVFQELGDKRFEVFARQVIALYRRNTGDYEAALDDLSVALNIARERNLRTNAIQVTIEQARVRFELADYEAALQLLNDIEPEASGTDAVHALVERGRVHTRLGSFAAARADLARAEEAIERLQDVGSRPLLLLAQGELAYDGDRTVEARRHFSQASALWMEDLPEAASVESRAYLGWIESGRGEVEQGRRQVRESLAQAQRMRRVALEARGRVLLARIEMAAGRAAEARRVLDGMPAAVEAQLGPELRALIQGWRSRAMARQGDRRGAAEAARAARRSLDETLGRVSDPTAVLARPDVRFISELE